TPRNRAGGDGRRGAPRRRPGPSPAAPGSGRAGRGWRAGRFRRRRGGGEGPSRARSWWRPCLGAGWLRGGGHLLAERVADEAAEVPEDTGLELAYALAADG